MPEISTFKKAPVANGKPDYVVRDLSLAGFGRKEIDLAADRDARSHGDARRVREEQAAQGRAHRWLAAHDHPDGGLDRDARGARRRHPLVLLQHLQHAGSRRRRHRRPWRAGVRRQGREPGRVLGLLLARAAVGRRRHPQPHPRRRRRSHAARSPRREGREGRVVPRQGSGPRRGARPVRAGQARDQGAPRLLCPGRQEHQGRLRRDHDGRSPPVPDGAEGRAAVPLHQRERLGHQVQVRQPLRLPSLAARRHHARDGRHAVRQGRGHRGLR